MSSFTDLYSPVSEQNQIGKALKLNIIKVKGKILWLKVLLTEAWANLYKDALPTGKLLCLSNGTLIIMWKVSNW